MDLISIIIPVYNTGQYLTRCIESIIKQTYTQLEIIIVDDGSCQETADLCDSLAKTDDRIEVIHKRNEGVSIARNNGLAIAKGEIICFVDSDDSIAPHMIEYLLEALEKNNAQIAICDATTITPGHPDEPDTIATLSESCVLEKKDITPAMLTLLAGSAWRCAYRRSDMSQSSKIFFPEGIKFSEDRIFNIAMIGTAQRIAYLKEPLYYRLIRSGSACFRFYPDMTQQIVQMHGILISTVQKYWGEQYIPAYEAQIAGQIKYAVTNYCAPQNGLSTIGTIKALRDLCNNSIIRGCLIQSGKNDIRTRLILSKMIIPLYFIGLSTNIKHLLCKTGQYRQ